MEKKNEIDNIQRDTEEQQSKKKLYSTILEYQENWKSLKHIGKKQKKRKYKTIILVLSL